MAQEPPPERRRLTRSHDSKLGGVAGGLADYFDLDPTLVRVLWVVALFIPAIGFGGVVAYVIMWFVMPQPEGDSPSAAPGDRPRAGASMDASLLLGIVIVAVGLMLLLRQSWIWMPYVGWGGFAFFWPAMLILLGAFIIYSARRRD